MFRKDNSSSNSSILAKTRWVQDSDNEQKGKSGGHCQSCLGHPGLGSLGAAGQE